MAPQPHLVAVTGATGALGRRVLRLLDQAPGVDRVVAVDGPPAAAPATAVPAVAVDVVSADLKPLLEGASELVHLAFEPGAGADDRETARANVDGTRRLLDAAGAVGVRHVVVVSSACVYGAWPDNPVPLTEEAAVRPNPGFGYGTQKAEIERLALAWAREHPGTTVAVLRPAVAVGEDDRSWLSRALRAASGIRAGDGDAPAQFVHLDDLAAAVELARARRLDGAYNVAADGWVSADQVRALAGSPPRVRVPEPVATRLAAWGWRWRVGRTPPGLIPYTVHPWVVANDRIRAAGWTPRWSNEEAFVAGHEGTPWSRLSPQRRQELTLGAAAALLVGAGAGLAGLLRRRSRRAG